MPRLLEQTPASAIDWSGWLRVDAHERALGAERGRERIKVFDREQLTTIASTMTAPKEPVTA